VVAERDLERGSVIDEGSVRLQRMPSTYAPPGGLHSIGDAGGRTLDSALVGRPPRVRRGFGSAIRRARTRRPRRRDRDVRWTAPVHRHGRQRARDPVDRRAGRGDLPGRRRHRPVPRPARQPGDRRAAGERDGVRTAHRDDRAGRRRLRIGGLWPGTARIARGHSPPPRRPSLTILQAIVLGITQGVTEFAPVSSSGHLIIVPWLFDWPILTDPNLNKTFDVALHLGTLVGALVYFRHDVARYAAAWFRSISTRKIGTTDERLAWALVRGTPPAVSVGATLERFIEDERGQPWLIALMLVVFGVVLYAVDRIASSRRHLDELGVRDGLVLGVAQALALQPGVSRS